MNKEDILEIITRLASERAPSGLEEQRGEIFKKIVEGIYTTKDLKVKTDKLGNYFLKLKGTSGKKAIG